MLRNITRGGPTYSATPFRALKVIGRFRFEYPWLAMPFAVGDGLEKLSMNEYRREWSGSIARGCKGWRRRSPPNMPAKHQNYLFIFAVRLTPPQHAP
jgi:hypothetical protein